MKGSLQVHVKSGLNSPSLVQSAFTSHGSDKQGSGTSGPIYIISREVIKKYSYKLEQLNPSPSMKGSLQVHVKFGLNSPSLAQSAFTSHGSDRQGSGTNGPHNFTRDFEKCSYTYLNN